MTQSLAYHLAEGLFAYIRSFGSPLYKRLNNLAFIHGCALAMLPDQSKDKRHGTGHRDLAILQDNIELLRDCYEPILDLDPTTFQKRSIFEYCMDLICLGLLGVIEDYNLVDTKILGEVYAMKFGPRRGES